MLIRRPTNTCRTRSRRTAGRSVWDSNGQSRRDSVLRNTLAALLIVAVPATATGMAQTVAAPALKAAFLYNFAKFTEWPAVSLAAGAPLVICTTDAAVFDELTKTTAGRSVDAHPVRIDRATIESPALRGCHVLYIPDLDARNTAKYLEAVKGAPVLAVGDGEDFVKRGGVAGFFVENGQMRFAVSVDAARRAGLELSSKLLSLARIL